MKIVEIDHKNIGNINATRLDSLSYHLLAGLRKNKELSADKRRKFTLLLNLCDGCATLLSVESRVESKFITERLNKCRKLLVYPNALDTDDEL